MEDDQDAYRAPAQLEALMPLQLIPDQIASLKQQLAGTMPR